MKFKKDHMLDALARVENEDGYASWPDSLTHSKALLAAWLRAVRVGYLRMFTDEEVEAYLANRRAVRAVLVAQLDAAVADELRPDDTWEGMAPSVRTLGEKLTQVCGQIAWIQRNTAYTLTETGVERLGIV